MNQTSIGRLTDAEQHALVQLTKSGKAAASWTLKLLADQLVALHVVETISYETVRQTLKKTFSSHAYTRAG